ncbi:hypothetical protein LTR95_019734, partial [Oleoguttula sp. CCFEE 5521]
GCVECDVTLSRPEWERLRDTRDRLRRDIDKLEEEEVVLLQRLADRRAKKIRLRKQIRLSERRTDDAVAKELDELEAAEAVENEFLPEVEPIAEVGVEAVELPFGFHDILEMPPSAWDKFLSDFPVSESGTVGG